MYQEKNKKYLEILKKSYMLEKNIPYDLKLIYTDLNADDIAFFNAKEE